MARVNEPARGSEGGVDGSALMRELLGRKRAILLPTLLAAVAALALVTLTPPRYSGVAKVLLENQESYLTKPDKATSDLGPTLDEAAVQSAAKSLATPDIARQAIEKLELDRRPEFHPSAFSRFIGTMLAGSRAGAYDDLVVETFMDRLSVFTIAHSRVLQIEFSSQDPQLAGLGANTVAELYLSQQADARRSEAKTAADWLSKRIEPLRAKVAELEAQADELRAQSGLLTGANGMTTPTQRLAELTTQIAAARAAQSAAHAKAQALSDMINSGRLEALPEAARDESLRRYIEARVAVKAEIAEASRTLLSNHPHMRELQGQLAGFDAEIRGAATKAVSAYRTDERIATDQIKDLEQAFNDQSRAVAATDGDAVKLQALELEAKAARDQLESYLQKYREAVARETTDAAAPNARVIETASAPANPSFPKRVPTVLLVTLAGFVLSLGVATARILWRGPSGRSRFERCRHPRSAEGPPRRRSKRRPRPPSGAGPSLPRRRPIRAVTCNPIDNLAAPTRSASSPKRSRSSSPCATRTAHRPGDGGGGARRVARRARPGTLLGQTGRGGNCAPRSRAVATLAQRRRCKGPPGFHGIERRRSEPRRAHQGVAPRPFGPARHHALRSGADASRRPRAGHRTARRTLSVRCRPHRRLADAARPPGAETRRRRADLRPRPAASSRSAPTWSARSARATSFSSTSLWERTLPNAQHEVPALGATRELQKARRALNPAF